MAAPALPSVPVLQLPRAAIVAASIKVLEMVESGAELRDRLWSNARLFRENECGRVYPPVLTTPLSRSCWVMPSWRRTLPVSCKRRHLRDRVLLPGRTKGGRVSAQMSAAHSPEQIERAVEAFTRIGKQLGVIA